jgi:hypothetical protein
MQLSVNGIDTFVATGGRRSIRRCPTIVLLHGAGFDHSTWALHSRWFAHHGYGVLAPDLPGHGRSSGAPLPTIADMADWTAALLDAAGAAKAKAGRPFHGIADRAGDRGTAPGKVSALSLIGTAATMTVGPDLLKAAEPTIPTRSTWSRSGASDFRPNSAAASRRDCGCTAAPSACCNSAGPACCSTISACNAYQNALAPPRRSRCPPPSFSANAT